MILGIYKPTVNRCFIACADWRLSHSHQPLNENWRRSPFGWNC